MIQVFSLNIRSEDGKRSLLFEKYDNLQVIDEKHLDKWRDAEKERFTEIFGTIKIDLIYRQRPDKNVKPMDIAYAVCEEMEVDKNEVINSIGDSVRSVRRLVKTKMFINQVLLDAGYSPGEIEENLWKNRLYYYYQREVENMFYAEPNERKRYDEIRLNVMEKLFN